MNIRFFALALLLIIFSTSITSAQDLAFYADVMINADRAEHRKLAAEQFSAMLQEELDASASIADLLESIPWVSFQNAPDSSFQTVSWYINLGQEYYADGYLIAHDQYWKLGSQQGQSSLRIQREIDFTDWQGGLIYKILPSPSHDDVFYLLTYGQSDEFTKFKILEPLRFMDGVPVVGMTNHFGGAEDEQQKKSRLTLQYSADSNAGFVLDETSYRIVYDNLTPVQGRLPGQGPTLVPDGSYRAYELDDSGNWAYVDKLYHQWNEGPLQENRDKSGDKELFKKKN